MSGRRLLPAVFGSWTGSVQAVGRPLLVILGAVVAVACGFAVTGESLHALVLVGVTGVAGLVVLAIAHPRAYVALLLPNAILFPTIQFLDGRGANPIDVLLPIALVTTWLLVPRDDSTLVRDDEVAARRRDLVRAGLAYYAVALLSLAAAALRGALYPALDSLPGLARAVQAAGFFYLVGRHARGREGGLFVRNLMLAGILVAAVINLPAIAFLGAPRAGAVIILGESIALAERATSIGGLPILVTSPNELAAACILAWALLLGMPLRRGLRLAGLAVSFVLLILTQSRSGLLGWMTLVFVHGLRAGHRRLLFLPLGAAAVVPLLPHEIQGRLLRTLVMQQGSFEAYSSIIRLFGWQAAIEIFRQNPLIGVGYLGFRHVSQDYNPLGLYLSTVENFFLETAVGMGILGLAALAFVAVACWRLGRAAVRCSEPGSPAHGMGAVTPAFLLGIAATNLTGDNLIGLLNCAQFAIFFALLARMAQDPACRRASERWP